MTEANQMKKKLLGEKRKSNLGERDSLKEAPKQCGGSTRDGDNELGRGGLTIIGEARWDDSQEGLPAVDIRKKKIQGKSLLIIGENMGSAT